jgi:ATP-dependent RNA helicase DeaD
MPDEVLKVLQKTVVNGKRLNIVELTEKNNKATIGGKSGKRNFGRGKFSKGGRNDRRGGRDSRGGDKRDGDRNRKPKFSRSKPKN